MKAGYARVKINPALGTAMSGFANRDRTRGCEGIHDDLYARALYLAHEGQQALMMGFDLLFFSREEADRFKGAIGRHLDLAPSQILLNTSHTHTGPKVGTWSFDPPSDPFFLQELEYAIVEAACRAHDAAVQATLWAGCGRTTLPMSRRLRLPGGKVGWGPEPKGEVCTAVPICLFRNMGGRPISLVFSVSCHPSIMSGYWISAEYPGVAMGLLDRSLGGEASLFLQGAGGDAKPRVTAEIDAGPPRFRPGTWEDVRIAGAIAADEVLRTIEAGLAPVEPDLKSYALELSLPMEALPDRAAYEAVLAEPEADRTRRLWAEEKIALLARGYRIPSSVPITVQGIHLGRGLRMVGVEGELVAGLGNLILGLFPEGVTFALGYSNGAQAYLPTDAMLDEEGYEVASYYEYRLPARFARGMDGALREALRQLQARGIG
jgi:neutral ceramidase